MSLLLSTETCDVTDQGSKCRRSVTYQEGEDPSLIDYSARCSEMGGNTAVCCDKRELDVLDINNITGIIGVPVYEASGVLSDKSSLCPADVVKECTDLMNDEILRTGDNNYTAPFRYCLFEKCKGSKELTHYEACKMGLLGLSPAEKDQIPQLTVPQIVNNSSKLLKDCEPKCIPLPPPPPQSNLIPLSAATSPISPLADLDKDQLVEEAKLRYSMLIEALKKKFRESKIMQGLLILFFTSSVMVVFSFKFTRGVFLLLLLTIILLSAYYNNESEINALVLQAKNRIETIKVLAPLIEKTNQLAQLKNIITLPIKLL